jgi:hypothetical protein
MREELVDGVESFPTRLGSHLRMVHPTLEWIKMVCEILSLEASVSTQVYRLRQSLLKLVYVEEFSPESQFVDPCLTAILPNVICEVSFSCSASSLHKRLGTSSILVYFFTAMLHCARRRPLSGSARSNGG